jgi:hypothetical protein
MFKLEIKIKLKIQNRTKMMLEGRIGSKMLLEKLNKISNSTNTIVITVNPPTRKIDNT